MDKALSGIRIIDMTHNQAGPALHADSRLPFGADVIKLQRSPSLATSRGSTGAAAKNSDSLTFLILNANKRGS